MRSRYKYDWMGLTFKNRREYHNHVVNKEIYIKKIRREVDYYKSKHSITSIIENLQSKKFRDDYWKTRYHHPSWFINE